MKITMAQLNPIVGDIQGNLRLLSAALKQAEEDQADLLVLPELFLTGYPPRDLLERPWFLDHISDGLQQALELSITTPHTGIILGLPTVSSLPQGKGLFNSAVLIHNGLVAGIQHKSLLPIYDVFDEARYFDPAPRIGLIAFKNRLLGISICEDAWNDPVLWPRGQIYSFDPIAELAAQGADILINISASPYHAGKDSIRHRLIGGHARRHGRPFIYVNQVGGNDELIFDGRSLAFDTNGLCTWVFPGFSPMCSTVDTDIAADHDMYTPQEPIQTVHDALVLGLSDYVRKCGFSKVVLGLSGGIDSAVCCCIAVEALGPGNVIGVTMPGPFSSPGSVNDSVDLAGNLGIELKRIGIAPIYEAYLDTMASEFAGQEFDITEENIQARIRGSILMSFSNKLGYLVLSTGNKSEMSVGYCTLYGDMSGGLSVIADVPKTMVYQLARYINREKEIIPWATIEKAPSAELRPDQTDQDSLPPYPILDRILHLYIEDNLSARQIEAQGFDRPIVEWIVRAVEKNEYKRKQAAPGLKVTTKAFGAGRRMPIAARIDF